MKAIIVILAFNTLIAYALHPVTDATSHLHLIKIMNCTKEQISNLRDLNSQISQLTEMLGNPEKIYHNLGFKRILKTIYAGMVSTDISAISLLYPYRSDVPSRELLTEELFIKQHISLTKEDIASVKDKREKTLVLSLEQAIKLSDESLAHPIEVESILSSIEDEEQNLQSILLNSNKIAAVMLAESIKTRKIMSKILEVMAVSELNKSNEWVEVHNF